ncbi:MAG TPA: zf-HC2 domain-containing protein [Myxococcales bacterium]
MTHAECQDLLLDLAYGELSPERTSEVAAHLTGCEECRKEKAALDQARRAAAPLRELEEPPAGFDDRILEAARTQAALDHDGNLGQVIEVSGSVSPLGIDAARIDAHANPKTRVERGRPRWLLRVAVAGSVAAAAAVALVVSTTVQSRRAPPAGAGEFQIRVQPAAPEAVDGALRDAEARKQAQAAAPAPQPAPQAAAPAAPAQDVQRNAQAPGQKISRRETASPRSSVEGSGGDAADSYVGAKQAAPSAPAKSAATGAAVSPAAEAENPADLESSAQQARHGGNYPLAAGLYRKAAALRRSAGTDPGTSAWDLAHAVECLAAAGLFDEARQVRQELSQLHPSEVTALAAARRALREVDSR